MRTTMVLPITEDRRTTAWVFVSDWRSLPTAFGQRYEVRQTRLVKGSRKSRWVVVSKDQLTSILHSCGMVNV